MAKFIDLTHQKFGDWEVVEYIKGKGWVCKCVCGNTGIVKGAVLRNGNSKSCGCKKVKHGMNNTKIHRLWSHMKERCYYEKHKSFDHYGGRGVKVCEEWLDSAKFIKWAIDNGYKDGLTLDRIDVNGDYEPSNCRFITNKEQQRNKRNNVFAEILGITKTVSEWAEISNLDRHTILYRLNKGESGIQLLRPGYKGGGLGERDLKERFNIIS